MTSQLELDAGRMTWAPLILIVPGIDNSGPTHWQSLWEAQRGDCRRVELGMWSKPHRNTWVNQLNLAIHKAQRPVVLVAHSLGCLAVAWWAQLERPATGNPVVGALLVAPPDTTLAGTDSRLTPFALAECRPLPFPAILVGSEDDPYCSLEAARTLASGLGARFENAGARGHINAESRLGDWPRGQRLLAELLHGHRLLRKRLATTGEHPEPGAGSLAKAFARYADRKRSSSHMS